MRFLDDQASAEGGEMLTTLQIELGDFDGRTTEVGCTDEVRDSHRT